MLWSTTELIDKPRGLEQKDGFSSLKLMCSFCKTPIVQQCKLQWISTEDTAKFITPGCLDEYIS